MDWPYYEVQLKPRRLENGKYKAGCTISEHAGDKVHVILPKWEVSGRELENKGAANTVMKLNAIQFLKREYGVTKMEQVKITVTT